MNNELNSFLNNLKSNDNSNSVNINANENNQNAFTSYDSANNSTFDNPFAAY